MAKKDIVVVGASAGGMAALESLAGGLPPDLQAAVFVVWHLPPGLKSVLPAVLSRAGPLPAANPADGDRIEPGRIYVAPNDRHLLLENGYVRVAKGPKENRFRPAIDPLFRSAAYVYGPRAIGVVLSGALDDGTAGLWAIKLRGGTAIVQDPADALHRSMPLSALAHVAVDHQLPVAGIAELLARLTREDAPSEPGLDAPQRERLRTEVKIAEGEDAREREVLALGELSPFSCPDCHGVMTLVGGGGPMRFRCHTGHAHSAGSLLEGATGQVEARLFAAVRALDEVVLLLDRMGEEHAARGDTRAADRCFSRAREAFERSRPIREAALQDAP